MTLSLRELARGDAPVLGRILRDTGAFSEDEVRVALELIALGEEPVADDYRFVIAALAREVVGYACYGLVPLSDGAYDLYWIAVDPARQGHGIGKALVREVETRVRERRGRWVLIETASKDSYRATRAFYDAIGYHEIARVPDFYRLGDDKIVYGRRIDR